MTLSVPSDATKANLDSEGDDPKQSRTDLAGLVDKFNTLKGVVGGLDAKFLPATGGTLTDNLALTNTTGSGRQVQFLNTSGTVRGYLALDSDETSPQKIHYRFLDTDGSTSLADLSLGASGAILTIGGTVALTAGSSSITVDPSFTLRAGATGGEVYHPDNPPPAHGGWETIRDFTATSGASDTISIADATNGLFEDGYDYRVQCWGLKRTSGSASNVDVQLGTGTSSISWITASYDNATYGALGTDPGGQVGTNTQARITQTSGQGVGSGDGAGLYGDFVIFAPTDSSSRTRMLGHFWQRDSPRALTWHAVRRTEAADTACKIVLSASTFAAVHIIVQRTPTAGDVSSGGGSPGGGGGSGSAAASNVAVTPAGTITSTNVQAALEELDGDIGGKQATLSPVPNIVFLSAGTGLTGYTIPGIYQRTGAATVSRLPGLQPAAISFYDLDVSETSGGAYTVRATDMGQQVNLPPATVLNITLPGGLSTNNVARSGFSGKVAGDQQFVVFEIVAGSGGSLTITFTRGTGTHLYGDTGADVASFTVVAATSTRTLVTFLNRGSNWILAS